MEEINKLAIVLALIILYIFGAGIWIFYKLDKDPKEGEYDIFLEKGKYYVKQKYWSGRYHYVTECDDEYPPYIDRKICFNTKEEARRYINEKVHIQ